MNVHTYAGVALLTLALLLDHAAAGSSHATSGGPTYRYLYTQETWTVVNDSTSSPEIVVAGLDLAFQIVLPDLSCVEPTSVSAPYYSLRSRLNVTCAGEALYESTYDTYFTVSSFQAFLLPNNTVHALSGSAAIVLWPDTATDVSASLDFWFASDFSFGYLINCTHHPSGETSFQTAIGNYTISGALPTCTTQSTNGASASGSSTSAASRETCSVLWVPVSLWSWLTETWGRFVGVKEAGR